MAQHRLSARVEFSPEAEKLYLEAKNKSEFILTAIEFYATYGKKIQEDLHEIKQLLKQEDIQEIKQLLYEIKGKGIEGQSDSSGGIEKKRSDVNSEQEMSEEERQMHEGIMSTLGAFLGRG